MSDLHYVSLKNASDRYSFRQVVEASQPPDGSLFVPSVIPQFQQRLLSDQAELNLIETANQLLLPFIAPDLSESQLEEVLRHTFRFHIPIKPLADRLFVEELYHGPTHAFKDVGARFLAGCLHQWRMPGRKTTILVATSGDTGGAVADAFYKLEGIEVIILYPKGKVSAFQEGQLAGLGHNIRAIAVEGSFDDCQSMVKQCFADGRLSESLGLTSANSINIGRWLPQMMFYAIAWHYLEKHQLEKTIAVPSGNYGNLASGVLFHQMGFPFKTLIAAHNSNDTIPRFLESGIYTPYPTQATYANAMDVSDPSNFSRFQYLVKQKSNSPPFQFEAIAVSDAQIVSSIETCWNKFHFLPDPHTATAFQVLTENERQGMMLATAHPYKFKEVIEKAIGTYPGEWKLASPAVDIRREIIGPDITALKALLRNS